MQRVQVCIGIMGISPEIDRWLRDHAETDTPLLGPRLKAAARRLRLMSHEERRRLIDAPLPSITVFGSHTWCGTSVNHQRMVQSHRLYRIDDDTDNR